MKAKSLTLLAGVSAGLIPAAPAPGALTGIRVELQPNTLGLLTCDVYAEFTSPDDRLLAVCGTADFPLQIGVVGGTFYQHPLGTDLPPIQLLVDVFPSIAFDTFVSIGLRFSEGSDETTLTPGWPGFGPSTLSTTSEGWFVLPVSGQAVPDKDGRVLLGQFSTADGLDFSGRFLIEAVSNGKPILAYVGFCHSLGTPCFEGDVNLDNMIDTEDFLLLLSCWGPVDDEVSACVFADHDNDGIIGILDFLALLAAWTPIMNVPQQGEIDADLNRDGTVNVADLLIFLQCHGGPPVEECEVADINGDGSIDAGDLLLILANWGAAA